MKEHDIRVFIDSVSHYFAHVTNETVSIGTPYLSTDIVNEYYDYSGIIGLAGQFRGCIYFSAPRSLLRHLLLKMNETDHGDENLLDMVGEVANTLSGNARKHFGPEFIISVPIAIKGQIETIRPPTDLLPYVIPIKWQAYRSSLVIYLSAN